MLLLACDGAVTVPALAWLARHGVPVLLLDRRGNLAAAVDAVGGAGLNFELSARLARLTQAQQVTIARGLIYRKLGEQIATLESFPSSVARYVAVSRIESNQKALDVTKSIDAIRVIEARAAAAYFRLWQRLPLKWKGLGSRPVPAEWLSIGLRSSALGHSNRNSAHPVMSMLNYAYAVLQSQVSIACASSGLDSTAGILHARRPPRPALVFDLMEPLRPVIDRELLRFIESHVFARSDFPIGDDGVVRLHPQLARAVASLKVAPQVVANVAKNFVADGGHCGQANHFGV